MNLQKQTIHHDLQQTLESKYINSKQTPKKVTFSTSNQRTKTKNSQLSSKKQIKKHKRKNNSLSDLNQRNLSPTNNHHNNLNSKIHDFGILTRCIKVYCQQELKEGKIPWKHVVKLIQAFNKSQLKQVSPQLQLLVQQIIKTLNYAHLKIDESLNHGKKIQSQKSQKDNKRKAKGRYNRHNLLFNKKAQKQSQFNENESSQQFSFSVNKSNQRTLKNNQKEIYLGREYFKEKIMSQIEQLENVLFQTSLQHQKLKQAKILALKLTKYQRWVQINKLRQIVKEQSSQLEQFKQQLQNKNRSRQN